MSSSKALLNEQLAVAQSPDRGDARAVVPICRSIEGNPVARSICDALAVWEQDCAEARRYIEHALVLTRCVIPVDVPCKGMLADWQVRRVVDHIRANLETTLRIDDVAKLVRLSASYFSRAFKRTVGQSFSDFVIQARIDLAKDLLLSTELPISQIALKCGLSDQPHLTRLFRRQVGLPPNTWRRRFRDPAFPPRRAQSWR